MAMVPSCAASPGFRQYLDELESLAQGRAIHDSAEWRRRLAACLDGEPRSVLHREVDQAKLRQQGAYFTGARMAARIVNGLRIPSRSPCEYFDPACGAGDLLLAVAKKLPLGETLESTIATWGQHLAGFDISLEFVRVAKARLVLLAAHRCRTRPPAGAIVPSRAFPGIVEADFLSDPERLRRADVTVMNPPFGYTTAPADCSWARGRVNAAAVFAEQVIRNSRPGARIAAILPDVLRSGTRYARWRNTIASLGSIRRQRPLGLFDRWTDVDVYFLDYQVQPPNTAPPTLPSSTPPSSGVGKRFAVHVGPVVPHRHPKDGSLVPYIHARSLPPWTECVEIPESRQFTGRLFLPPFVVVRRTSRPNDKSRAVASLVFSNEPVAVENHLIVLLPTDGTASTCRSLVLRLRSPKTDAWINSRLRCRHLTTAVLANMPWWKNP